MSEFQNSGFSHFGRDFVVLYLLWIAHRAFLCKNKNAFLECILISEYTVFCISKFSDFNYSFFPCVICVKKQLITLITSWILSPGFWFLIANLVSPLALIAKKKIVKRGKQWNLEMTW